MRITPRERSDDRRDNRRTWKPPTGVVKWLRATGKRLVGRVGGWLARADAPADGPADQSGTGLRVADSEKGEAEVRVRATVEGGNGTDRPPTPGERSPVKTQRRGERIRIYDPDEPEAFVTSDTWDSVER